MWGAPGSRVVVGRGQTAATSDLGFKVLDRLPSLPASSPARPVGLALPTSFRSPGSPLHARLFWPSCSYPGDREWGRGHSWWSACLCGGRLPPSGSKTGARQSGAASRQGEGAPAGWVGTPRAAARQWLTPHPQKRPCCLGGSAGEIYPQVLKGFRGRTRNEACARVQAPGLPGPCSRSLRTESGDPQPRGAEGANAGCVRAFPPVSA